MAPSSVVSMHGLESRSEALPAARPATPQSAGKHELARAGRFQPGELVAARYRILALLGRGGMGEVYRADDLKLEQHVALKFLREEIVADSAARARFLSEVRLARSVTHVNVCRVHDVGEVDGLLYLSMEYVDGEELAALLRRIGAPSEKKALEIAGQLCAGLAAAHAKGVLHRDLKPANVMIDSAGKVRITDFGLAIIEEDERERGVVAGTPDYMAPEQLAGGEATAKSDIYALGLVLYELFTGVRVWKAADLGQLRNLHATRTPDPPSAHVRALDERIERGILACLEREPARRPRSPTAVAVALTGADPIAAALAAGETPTPEMVAASGGEGTLSTAMTALLLATIVALFVALIFVAPRASLYGRIALDEEPAVLAYQARGILEGSGLAVPDGDRASGFCFLPVERFGRRELDANFWYREAPFSLQPSVSNWEVAEEDPPPAWPGMVYVRLSMTGKLRSLEVVPPRNWDPARSGVPCDWEPLFVAAGLQFTDFKPLEPQFTPLQGCDKVAGWWAPDPGNPDAELQVGGASYQGRPVFFALAPWWPRHVPSYVPGSNWSDLVWFWLWLPALIVGIALARRSLTSGRGDRRAAARLAVVVVAVRLFVALLRANHTPGLLLEQRIFVQGLSSALYLGGLVWLLYLALEPYVRRVWPDHLVSWNRLLSGRWRDPLVARDLLVGLALGMFEALIMIAKRWMELRLSPPQASPAIINFPDAKGLPGFVAWLLTHALEGVQGCFLLLFALVALRFLVRRGWIAYALCAPLVLLLLLDAPTEMRLLDWTGASLGAAVFLFVIARFGFFALAIAAATFLTLINATLTYELSKWYGAQTVFLGLVFGVLALAAARFATGKRVQLA